GGRRRPPAVARTISPSRSSPSSRPLPTRWPACRTWASSGSRWSRRGGWTTRYPSWTAWRSSRARHGRVRRPHRRGVLEPRSPRPGGPSRAGGVHPPALTIALPAPVDQSHGGGKPVTERLAQLAVAAPSTRVLDVGGGFGGPARTLAGQFGCLLTSLEL